MSPEQSHNELAEVSFGSPPRGGGGPSRRHVQADVPATPTRKGHTRGRSIELSLQSPHAKNPSADYIPPSHLTASPRGVSVRRRSVTPIPPYEPPKERYTPPREVVVSPPAGERKPVRRATKKKRVSVKTEKPPVQLWVKTEPPEVDLTTPAPPASPGDDPILLVGPPSIRVQRASVPPADSREVSLVDFEMDITLPGHRNRSATGNADEVKTPARSSSVVNPAFDFSRLSDNDGGLADNDQADTSTEVDYGTLLDDGGFTSIYDDGGADSDSDDENVNADASVGEGEGDFTGRFSEFQAPLKLDPPDNGDDRMEKWARPISPHPKRLSLLEPKEEDVDVGLDRVSNQASRHGSADDSITSLDSSVIICEPEEEERINTRPGYADKRGRRLTLSEVEAIKFGPKPSSPASAELAGNGDVSREEGVADESFEQDGDNQIHNRSMQPQTRQAQTILDKTSILDKNSAHHFDSTRVANNAYQQEVR